MPSFAVSIMAVGPPEPLQQQQPTGEPMVIQGMPWGEAQGRIKTNHLEPGFKDASRTLNDMYMMLELANRCRYSCQHHLGNCQVHFMKLQG